MRVTIEEHILHWLGTLGYSLLGRTREEIIAMFLREARQWELPPWELDRLVREGYEAQRRQPRGINRGAISRMPRALA